MTLTPRQSSVAVALRNFTILRGRSPTLQELADQLGIGKLTAREHLVQLERKGVILRPRYRHFSLELVPGVRLPDENRPTKFPVLGTVGAGGVVTGGDGGMR